MMGLRSGWFLTGGATNAGWPQSRFATALPLVPASKPW